MDDEHRTRTRHRAPGHHRIVLRRDLSSSVLRVEYEIADTIREPLSALLDQLAEWGRSYTPDGPPRDSAKANSSAVHSPSE
jgi:DNA-binding HxlR family transcriptional regulator